MSRIARVIAFVTAVTSVFAITCSTAGAVTWHNSGDTAFTATAGAGTLSSTGVGLGCTGATMTGVQVGTTPYVGATWMGFHGTATYSGCVLGGVSATEDCTYDATGTITGPDTWTGQLHLTCSVFLSGSKVCHTHEVRHFVFDDPPDLPAKWTFTTGGAVATTNGPFGCPLGNNEQAHRSAQTFTVTAGTGGPAPHNGPRITRTA